MIFYKYKFKFIGQFKVDPNKPWPWESDPKRYKFLKSRAFRAMTFNYLVVSHFTVIPILWYYDYQLPWTWEPIIPSEWQMFK